MPKRERSIQEDADTVVESYATGQAVQAYLRAERERHGSGCRCLHCITDSVRELNSWVDFLVDDVDQAELYKASVVKTKNGRLGILMGFDLLQALRRK